MNKDSDLFIMFGPWRVSVRGLRGLLALVLILAALFLATTPAISIGKTLLWGNAPTPATYSRSAQSP